MLQLSMKILKESDEEITADGFFDAAFPINTPRHFCHTGLLADLSQRSVN